ncbi:MAG: hypothetical protein ACREDP_23260, partial [Bradyrhizobium sp.]
DHAYFPALTTCIAFTDFMSGLYAGKLDGHGLAELKVYALRFMNSTNYDSLRLEILYEAIRHKTAHLAYPYVVFDTATKPRRFIGQKARRVTWTVCAGRRALPIEVMDLTKPRSIVRAPTPWPISYNCRVTISVRKFYADIVKSIYGPSGYLRNLEVDKNAREHFERCMVLYFPA